MFSKDIPVVSFIQFMCPKFGIYSFFLRLKFDLKVLLHVKDLTFCNSGYIHLLGGVLWQESSGKVQLPHMFVSVFSTQSFFWSESSPSLHSFWDHILGWELRTYNNFLPIKLMMMMMTIMRMMMMMMMMHIYVSSLNGQLLKWACRKRRERAAERWRNYLGTKVKTLF